MKRKIAFFSLEQLLLLALLLRHSERPLGVQEISRKIKFRGESLGGLISSLARNKFRGEPLIEPWGRDKGGVGMRWRVNSRSIEISMAKAEVQRLLAGYQT